MRLNLSLLFCLAFLPGSALAGDLISARATELRGTNCAGANLRRNPGLEPCSSDRHIDKSWKWSLAPLAASQALDVASSYGMRELNPALAGPDGRFGMKSATLKLGVTGALVGVEYLIVKAHPGAARPLAKLNWAASAVTVGFAAHNFAIK